MLLLWKAKKIPKIQDNFKKVEQQTLYYISSKAVLPWQLLRNKNIS